MCVAKLDRLSRNLAFLAAVMDSGCEFAAADMPAANPNVRKADRDLARERADALEWHLRRLFWKR